jgi:hypothetical protein
MHQSPDEQPFPTGPLLPTRGVATRYSVCPRTIKRWTASGIIPPPDETINGRFYWRLKTLERGDQRRTVEAGAGLSKQR